MVYFKNIALITALATLLSAPSFAKEDPNYHFSVGLGSAKGSFDENYTIGSTQGSTLSASGNAGSLDFSFGPNYKINDTFSISPELFFSTAGFEFKTTRSAISQNGASTASTTQTLETSASYGLRSNFSIDINKKSYVNFLLGYSLLEAKSSANITTSESPNNQKEEKTLTGDSILYGIGWGYRLDDSIHTLVSIERTDYSIEHDYALNIPSNIDFGGNLIRSKYDIELTDFKFRVIYNF